jgi:hypothetical protein
MKGVRQELRGTGVTVALVMPAVVDTELALGTDPGGAPRLTPAAVATAVADVIAKPRFETFVPGYAGALTRVLALLPQWGKDLMYRRLVPNQLQAADRSARAEYEARRLG